MCLIIGFAIGQRVIKFQPDIFSDVFYKWQDNSLCTLNQLPVKKVVRIQVVVAEGLSEEAEKRRRKISKLRVSPKYLSDIH